MRAFIQRRPWIWILLLLAMMVLANLVLVWVSLTHPVVSANGP